MESESAWRGRAHLTSLCAEREGARSACAERGDARALRVRGERGRAARARARREGARDASVVLLSCVHSTVNSYGV